MKTKYNPKSLQNLKSRKKGDKVLPGAGRPPEILNAAMKKLTKEELEEIAAMIVKGDINELKKVAQDEKQSVIKVMIASVCVAAIKKGDMEAVDKLLNRLVGKVKDQVEHSGSGIAPTIIFAIPNNNRD